MGLFKSIGKAFSSIWNGVKKVFKAVVNVVKKVLASDLFKIVMIALSVFTLGTSLMAFGTAWGAEAAVQGATFMSKFVAGSKAFMGSMMGKAGVDKAGDAAAGAAAMGPAPGAMNVGEAAAMTNAGGVASTAADIAAAVPGATQAADKLASMNTANAAKAAVPAVESGGGIIKTGGDWLSKAASGAKTFLESPGGGQIIGNVLGGIGEAGMQKDQQDFETRNERRFDDANDPGMKKLGALDYSVHSKPGWAADPDGGRLSQAERVRQNLYGPTIKYETTPVMAGG